MKTVKKPEAPPRGTLNPRQLIVLSKAVTEKDAKALREGLLPGPIVQEFTVDVIGKLEVGEDYEMSRSIPWKEVALFLLEGQSPKGALRQILKALESPIDEQLEGKLKELASASLGKIPCRGRITGTTIVKLHQEEDR